jgi:hypothetical protein
VLYNEVPIRIPLLQKEPNTAAIMSANGATETICATQQQRQTRTAPKQAHISLYDILNTWINQALLIRKNRTWLYQVFFLKHYPIKQKTAKYELDDV